MQDLEFIRYTDELGRIVLPMEIRMQMDLPPRSAVKITYEDGRIIVEKISNGQKRHLY
jgi:AbrB family looped-hinge helix DNA binding protein